MQATEQTKPELFLEIQAEQFWPRHARTIHCPITGQSYGTVSTDYIIGMIRRYGNQDMSDLQCRINNYRFFGAPCPEWTGLVPNQIKHNQLYDPVGFLIYVLAHTIHTEKWHERSLDARMQHMRDKARLYEILSKHPERFEDYNKFSNKMFLLRAEGCVLPLETIRDRQILMYQHEEIRQSALKMYIHYYEGWKKKKINYQEALNFDRASRKIYGVDKLDEEQHKNFIELLTTSIWAEVLEGADTNTQQDIVRALSKLSTDIMYDKKRRQEGFKVTKPGQKVTFGFGAQS